MEPTDQPCTEPDPTSVDFTRVDNADDDPGPANVTADDLAGVDVTVWAPWAKELTDILDAVRRVGASHNPAASGETGGESDRESKGGGPHVGGSSCGTEIVELGVRARVLLDRIGGQPSLPGAFGRAVDVLRAPTNSGPVRINDALERLASLAVLLDSGPRPGPTIVQQRGGSPRDGRRGQASLPGLEPPQSTKVMPYQVKECHDE